MVDILKSNIEQFWGKMGKLDDIFSGTKRFGVLSKLAKTLLVLPNSNADSEALVIITSCTLCRF
jgi:hypothetical protein